MNNKDLPKLLQKKPKQTNHSEEHIGSVSSPIQYAQKEVQQFLNPFTLLVCFVYARIITYTIVLPKKHKIFFIHKSKKYFCRNVSNIKNSFCQK